MAENNDRFTELTDELDKHIIAVKGALELAEASVSESEVQSLILKAIERMDEIQRLSHEMIITLKHLFEKINEKRKD